MIAALATVVFLATLWMMVVVAASILEESGAKIAAALKGRLAIDIPQPTAYARVRARSRMKQPLRARPRWRDAA